MEVSAIRREKIALEEDLTRMIGERIKRFVVFTDIHVRDLRAVFDYTEAVGTHPRDKPVAYDHSFVGIRVKLENI